MNKIKKKTIKDKKIIANNRSARHNYFIEEVVEAGVCLQGWEVKSLREGRLQLRDSYIDIKKGEAYLKSTHISASPHISTHSNINNNRVRKLLLHKKQINRFAGLVEKKGFTIVVLDFYWYKNKIKASIAAAKGKKMYDKRDTEKKRDWQRDKQRILKKNNH